MKQLLSGNEAIALGAYHAGTAVAAAYPGTPSTEILQELARMDGIYVEWSPNEKVALEVAMGASYGGVRALASMKHVGLNVAADPLFAASTTGVDGGLVIITADDPGMHSSQGEQDNRHFARFAKVPMLEPTDSQDAYDVISRAFDISEEFDTPVLVRSTTRISHCSTVVQSNGTREENLALPGFRRSLAKYVMVPSNARSRRVAMEERVLKLREYVNSFPMNEMTLSDRKLGIVTGGVAYQYAREVFPDASFLKIVTTYPFPDDLMRRFAEEVDQLITIEELDPYLEEEIRRLGIPVKGKDFFPLMGELSPETVEAGAISAGLISSQKTVTGHQVSEFSPPLPLRRPQFCAGCPHVGAMYILHKLGFRTSDGPVGTGDFVVTSDIGCYTLGVNPPLSALDTCACMGASIGQAIGLEKSGIPNKVVAVIGDSTFMHSGITGLVDAVYNQAGITVVILDNDTTAMTGHQGHPGTGISARGEESRVVKLEDVVRGVGVEDLSVVNAFDLDGIEAAIKKSTDNREPSVVIVRGACALAVRTSRPSFSVDVDACISCYLCLDIGCPAISLVEGVPSISESCIGCGICAQVCPQEAILENTE